jgi:hypothetical protein
MMMQFAINPYKQFGFQTKKQQSVMMGFAINPLKQLDFSHWLRIKKVKTLLLQLGFNDWKGTLIDGCTKVWIKGSQLGENSLEVWKKGMMVDGCTRVTREGKSACDCDWFEKHYQPSGC